MNFENRDSVYIICPYCGWAHCDPWKIVPYNNPIVEVICDKCEKEFIAEAEYDVVYVTRKIENEGYDDVL